MNNVIFKDSDPVGTVKCFNYGEYRGNKLPLVYTKGESIPHPMKKGEVIQSMSAQVIYNGELKDVLEVDLNLVFGE